MKKESLPILPTVVLVGCSGSKKVLQAIDNAIKKSFGIQSAVTEWSESASARQELLEKADFAIFVFFSPSTLGLPPASLDACDEGTLGAYNAFRLSHPKKPFHVIVDASDRTADLEDFVWSRLSERGPELIGMTIVRESAVDTIPIAGYAACGAQYCAYFNKAVERDKRFVKFLKLFHPRAQ